MKKITHLLIVSGILLSLTSCATTKLVMDSNLGSEPKDALLTGMKISTVTNNQTSAQDNYSLLELVIDASQNSVLDDFGFTAENKIAEWLDTKGFVQVIDGNMAKREDLRNRNGSNSTLLGTWTHPETSAYTPNYFTGPVFGFFNAADVVQSVKGDSNINYFTYVYIRIIKSYAFGYLMGTPVAVVKVVVVDTEGEPVLEAKTRGEGESKFWGIDFSEENLKIALDTALAELK